MCCQIDRRGWTVKIINLQIDVVEKPAYLVGMKSWTGVGGRRCQIRKFMSQCQLYLVTRTGGADDATV
jgi:hypothetical protein